MSERLTSNPRGGLVLNSPPRAYWLAALGGVLVLGLMLGANLAPSAGLPVSVHAPTARADASSAAPLSSPAAPSQGASSPGDWSQLPIAAAPSERMTVAMVYDPADGYTLLFGGCLYPCYGTGETVGQTWTYKAGVWTQIFPTNSPSARGGAMITYDAEDGYVLMFGGYNSGPGCLSDTWEFKAGQWTQLYPTIHPPANCYAEMAYDPTDGYVLMYGGGSNGTYYTSTWTFAGGQWANPTTPTTNPGTRMYGMMVWDAHDGYLLLHAGYNSAGAELFDTWSYVGGTWTQIATSTAPPDQGGPGGLVYDPTDGYVLLFGGLNGSVLGQTWTYAAGTWTQLNPSTPPSPRQSSEMVWDAADGKVVLFGGYDGSSLLNDTWTFLGGQWSATSPSPRYHAQIVYDVADGYLLMFGGCANTICFGSNVVLNDTWTYKGGTWTELHPAVVPEGRGAAGITYDAADGYVLMFGGYNSGPGTIGDTWEYKAGVWSQIFSPTGHPPDAEGPGLAYDAADGYVLMFGGGSNGSYFSQTWKFSGGDWTALTPAVSPPARDFAAMVYDSEDGYVVMSGGTSNGNYLQDTWTYSGGAWTEDFASPHPVGLGEGGLADDVSDGYVVAFAGNNNGTLLSQTWAFLAGVWTPLNPAAAPSPRENTAMAYDPTGPFVVMIGGWDGSQALPDDWTWSGSLVEGLAATLSSSTSVLDLSQSVTLSAGASGGTGGYTYAWSVSSGGLGCPASTAATLSCTPTAPGSYTVSVTVTDSSSNTATSAPVTIVVNPLLASSLTASPGASEVGESVTLSATVSGGTPSGVGFGYGYGLATGSASFSCAGGSYSGNTVSYLCTGTAVGNYTLVFNATDSLGVGTTADLTYAVGPGPSVTTPAASTSAADVGQKVTFSTSAYGGSGVYDSYAWSGLPAGDCTGVTTAAVVCTLANSGSLSVAAQVTDSKGETSSWSHALTFAVTPDPTVLLSAGVQIDTGASATVTATVSGGVAPYSVGWSVNGTLVEGESGTTYSAVFPHSGSYEITAVVTDAVGEKVTSAPTEVLVVNPTVAPPPPQKQSSSGISTATLELYGVVVAAVIAVGLLTAFSLRNRRNRSLGGGGMGGIAQGGSLPAQSASWEEYQVPRGGWNLPPQTPGTPPPPPPGAPRNAAPPPPSNSGNGSNDNLRNLL